MYPMSTVRSTRASAPGLPSCTKDGSLPPPARTTETSSQMRVTIRSSRASATTSGCASGVTASSAAGSTTATVGAASSVAGISNAMRSDGSTPNAPVGSNSSTPRPDALQRIVQREGSAGSTATEGAAAPSVPASMRTVRETQASSPAGSAGGGAASRMASESSMREPARTGGESVDRRSVPVPSSASRTPTVPAA